MRRFVELVAVLSMPVVLLAPSTSASTPDPLTCAGYSEPRLFLDAQGWWTAEPGQTGSDFGHIHVSTCFPLNQTVSGVVPFDIQLVMHRDPGTIFRIVPQLCHNTGETYFRYADIPLDLRCDPVTQVTCSFWVHYDWDTAAYASAIWAYPPWRAGQYPAGSSSAFRPVPALVAQWIEQRFPKPCVAGSTPAEGTPPRNRIPPEGTSADRDQRRCRAGRERDQEGLTTLHPERAQRPPTPRPSRRRRRPTRRRSCPRHGGRQSQVRPTSPTRARTPRRRRSRRHG